MRFISCISSRNPYPFFEVFTKFNHTLELVVSWLHRQCFLVDDSVGDLVSHIQNISFHIFYFFQWNVSFSLRRFWIILIRNRLLINLSFNIFKKNWGWIYWELFLLSNIIGVCWFIWLFLENCLIFLILRDDYCQTIIKNLFFPSINKLIEIQVFVSLWSILLHFYHFAGFLKDSYMF